MVDTWTTFPLKRGYARRFVGFRVVDIISRGCARSTNGDMAETRTLEIGVAGRAEPNKGVAGVTRSLMPAR